MSDSIKRSLDHLLRKLQHGSLSVRYWDGEEVTYGESGKGARIIFHETMPKSFNLLDPMLAFGEAYMDGVFDVEGSWDDLMRVIAQNKKLLYGKKSIPFLQGSIRKMAVDLSFKMKQKKDVQHHYDLGNDFFALWLDETMSYSCGYFKKESDSLHQAQIQKIDHVLKKLQLKPGETLLDIGSGWGWLILRAAKEYKVKATGITLSEAQHQATQERIRDQGLESFVDVKLLDYLDLDETMHSFDKVVSVGMFEHVGKANLTRYLKKVETLLKPGGLSLLHSIMGLKEGGINSWSDRHIFPSGYIPSLREVIALFPDHDFHLLHAESLRMHYARTLDHWMRNFREHEDEVRQMFDQRFIRMWSLYLLASAAQFRSTGLDIYQLLFSKGLNNDLPLTLDHVYTD